MSYASLMKHLRGLSAALVLGLVGATPAAAQITFDPEDCDAVMPQFGTVFQDITICIPGDGGVPLADVYILADTTGSMGSVIDQVKADAVMIANDLLDRAGTDIQVGIGNYKDFPFDDFAFQHQQAVTDSATDIVNAINGWNADGGNDGSEAQLYALTRVATDPAIGFRPGAKRIIVWFGDAPGHDPICTDISGEGSDITEATTTADLLSGGLGGTTVIAISVPTGFPASLNDDPQIDPFDYIPFCTIGGLAGQATRLAAATGGIDTSIGNPRGITQAILDSIDSVLSMVDVSLCAVGDDDFLDFVALIDPPIYTDVLIPSDPRDEVCLDFRVVLEDQLCIENVSTYEGEYVVKIDEVESASCDVTITQPHCAEAICMSFVGFTPTATPFAGGEPSDIVLATPDFTFPVLLDEIPVFQIPANPALDGLHVYLQVLMVNAFDFPTDPIKVTSGLDITLGSNDLGQPYGVPSGMAVWLNQPALLGGVFDMGFSIDGFVP
ncbi:MAG: vWA domain-containing protein [Planctomycetota bacterium]|jgi:hypothetical protein